MLSLKMNALKTNARPDYHAACKDECGPLNLIEVSADVFEMFVVKLLA